MSQVEDDMSDFLNDFYSSHNPPKEIERHIRTLSCSAAPFHFHFPSDSVSAVKVFYDRENE
jgi:hypothetical protein